MRRTVLIAAVGLVSATASGLVLPTAAAAAAASLTLNPSHGPASTSVTMTYAFPITTGCPIQGAVTFAWDGVVVASQPIGRSCTATAQATAPNGHSGAG